jgi:hypothetical protein
VIYFVGYVSESEKPIGGASNVLTRPLIIT